MAYQLIVLQSFLTYSEGDAITDPTTIADILAGPYSVYVIKSSLH